MKVGELVKYHIKTVFDYCDTVDHGELSRLMDKEYSKKTFGISSYPFCTEPSLISISQSRRYWTTIYIVRGKTVRVCSQWVEKHKDLFSQYLLAKNIVSKGELPPSCNVKSSERVSKSIGIGNSRFKGRAIGNAQNQLVRNILSNLGDESFSKNDWVETKEYFSNQCAYCGKEESLLIEHAIPINRRSLGEHRLGNLVPSCKQCNRDKADKDFHEFLGDDLDRIKKIEKYMESQNYVPLGDNKQVALLLDMAYQETSSVAKRYIAILNELFPSS